MRNLRIGIDGRGFTSAAAGVRRYTAALAQALLALGEPIELVALGGRYVSTMPRGVGHVEEPAHPPTNAGWSLVGLPRAAARARVDLIHAPAYTAPFWAGRPVVLTIHDVSYARHPEWYPYQSDQVRRWYYRRCALAATHVLTDSRFSASEITAAYGIPASRITVVPLGVETAFAPGGDADAGGSGVPPVSRPYLLHVGDLHERRNLALVVEAMLVARTRGAALAGLSLVLAGVDRGTGERVQGLAAAAGAAQAVVRLGPVAEDRLRALYRGAAALVYPSRYEGFGLPLIEAMASGTPVLAARAASIPEVVGDAGILLDPDDAAAWTDAIVAVAGNADASARLRAAGLVRAAGFTWERTARQTLAVYRQVASA